MYNQENPKEVCHPSWFSGECEQQAVWDLEAELSANRTKSCFSLTACGHGLLNYTQPDTWFGNKQTKSAKTPSVSLKYMMARTKSPIAIPSLDRANAKTHHCTTCLAKDGSSQFRSGAFFQCQVFPPLSHPSLTYVSFSEFGVSWSYAQEIRGLTPSAPNTTRSHTWRQSTNASVPYKPQRFTAAPTEGYIS